MHQRDNSRLLQTLKNLRDLGNTVLVVEHDEDTMKAADWIIDIGPGAGVHGGDLIASGIFHDFIKKDSLTADYLSKRKVIPYGNEAREGNGLSIELKGATANNLKNVDIKLDLGKFISVTGVSGSGKSTLINDLLLNALKNKLGHKTMFPTEISSVTGVENIDKVIVIDQESYR